MNKKATKARLDPKGDAQPKTRLVAHYIRGERIGPATVGFELEYENENGERSILSSDSDSRKEIPAKDLPSEALDE